MPGKTSYFVVALLACAAVASSGVAQQADSEEPLPLQPTRTIRFTTDEGTWISLDISPDGSTIVFDLLGDLYVLPIAGGTATRITSGMAFDAQPRYSPDGQTIVFVSDRSGSHNVWLADADGQNPRPVTREVDIQFVSPEWTPDGRGIVVSKGKGVTEVMYGLHQYLLGGGTGVALAGGKGNEPYDNYVGAAFGPDPSYLYTAVATGGWSTIWQVATFDRESGHTDVLTNELRSAMRPAISPDGKYLLFATRHDAVTALKLRELGTGDERWLAQEVQFDLQDSRPTRDVMPGMSFTPDGRALVASYDGKIWRIEVPSGTAMPIPFTADVEQQLGPLVKFDYPFDDSRLTLRRIQDPRPSPDGQRLAFSALDRLWVMELPGGAPRRLTNRETGEFKPAWSPDGRYIAYVTWNDTDGGDVYRARADGSVAPERLTRESAYYKGVTYTPEGSRLMLLRAPRRARTLQVGPSRLQLAWMSADGGDLTEIHRPGQYGSPHFTSEGDRVHVYDRAEGLISMRWDGTDVKSILEVTGSITPSRPEVEPPAQEILLSPRGDRALALVGNDLYLVTLPMPGSAVTLSIVNPSEAPLPVRRLTNITAEFPGWSPDGGTVHYSLGRTFFIHDVATAENPETTVVTITVPRDRPSGTLVLRGARIVTMRGDEVLKNGDLVVTDNRITAVGARGQVDAPADARVIDVSGKTILPGYVDIHAHMRPAAEVHRPQPWMYLVNLAYGVTTSRDPSASPDVFSYADLVETGALLGPRIFSTGPSLSENVPLESLDDARNILRPFAEYLGTETVKQYTIGSRRARQWFNIAARESGLTPTVETYADFQKNLTEVIDGYAGLEHKLHIFPMAQDVIQLLVQAGVTNTPTFFVSNTTVGAGEWFYSIEGFDLHDDPKFRRFTPHPVLDRNLLQHRVMQWQPPYEYVYQRQAAELRKLVEAGGRVALGSHGDLQGLGAHVELWAIASGGMRPHDVLRAGTIFGAEAIGHGAHVGSLEPGKLADLQVLDANPLEDIRKTNTIRYVMKNGRLYEADTLNEIWPRERELPEQWWWRIDPKEE